MEISSFRKFTPRQHNQAHSTNKPFATYQPPQQTYQTEPSPLVSFNIHEKVLIALNSLDANNQLLHSHSQSIVKIEAQVGQIAAQVRQIATALNRREEGKLSWWPMLRDNTWWDRSTSHFEQVQAIMALRNGKVVNNHVEKKKDEENEAPQNLH